MTTKSKEGRGLGMREEAEPRMRRWFFANLLGIHVAGIVFPLACNAFSLMGPYASWMDIEKDYQQPGDIGGPMNIGEGYRWNIPVITYGFDRSFLDYFGTNGVAAVESAIAIINEMPPASIVDPQSYAPNVWEVNSFAAALGALDLKTMTLHLLLEQLGLADPLRWVFSIRDFTPAGGGYLFDIILRNFDVATIQPTPYVNNTLFTYEIQYDPSKQPSPGTLFCAVLAFPVDPHALLFTAAASINSGTYGSFLTGLSRDDVGGLRYLLSGREVRVENLLPDIHLAGTNSGSLVGVASRPGIEKITLVRHPVGTLNGQFMPFTNRWTDIYYNFNAPGYQAVERVTTQPDIVFSGRDLGTQVGWTRTGTTNWANNAGLNGNTGGAGPGVIQPSVEIAFNTIGPFYLTYPTTNAFPTESNAIRISGWANFDWSTNGVFLYPNVQVTFQPSILRFQLVIRGTPHDFNWVLGSEPYSRFLFQTTTNFSTWTTLTTFTNSGSALTYQYLAATNEMSRFFRAVQVK